MSVRAVRADFGKMEAVSYRSIHKDARPLPDDARTNQISRRIIRWLWESSSRMS